VSLLAAHINDAAISVQDADRILYREPGFALLDDDGLSTGLAAFGQARLKPRRIQHEFWSGLQTAALADRRFSHLSSADLVSRQLEQIWQAVAKPGDSLVVAVPAYMGHDNLSLLLGIATELKVPIVAMVDAAVAATRRHYTGAVPVHVDLGLHATMLTRIAQSGQARLDRSELIPQGGLLALYDAWIRAIAEAFVRQSRFDPLHTADTEQTLQDRLPDWIAAASAADRIALQIDYRGITHHAELDSLEFVAAAAPIYHRIVSSLRALYRADERPALQLTDRAARMPGLADMLSARVGGEVFLLETGATARGLLARCRDMRPGDAAVSLIRQLPWDQSAVALKDVETTRHAGQPTHLLHGDTAYAIDSRALTLGLQSADGGRCIELQQDMPGVSRRHCSVQRENGQCIVRDYSRYGTFLNGHRIDGSAVLQVGDRLRLGTPGFELRLIATEDDSGS
jgi:FHA domain